MTALWFTDLFITTKVHKGNTEAHKDYVPGIKKNFNFTIKMATETERKFLVKGEFRHLITREINIIQTYMSVDSR